MPNGARQRLNLQATKITVENLIQKGHIKDEPHKRNTIFMYVEKGNRQSEIFLNINKNTSFNYVDDVNHDELYQVYADEVLNHWNNNLRERLKKYARVPLFKPNS